MCAPIDKVYQKGVSEKVRLPQFAVVKRLWGLDKVRYRGLAKNANRVFAALALANLYLSRSRLMGQVRP
jgi:hypothetical protein